MNQGLGLKILLFGHFGQQNCQQFRDPCFRRRHFGNLARRGKHFRQYPFQSEFPNWC